MIEGGDLKQLHEGRTAFSYALEYGEHDLARQMIYRGFEPKHYPHLLVDVVRDKDVDGYDLLMANGVVYPEDSAHKPLLCIALEDVDSVSIKMVNRLLCVADEQVYLDRLAGEKYYVTGLNSKPLAGKCYQGVALSAAIQALKTKDMTQRKLCWGLALVLLDQGADVNFSRPWVSLFS